jgi:hypothetical protein
MFLFSLARDLGKTVAELGTMSSEEYTYWMAFYNYQNQQLKKQQKRK